MARKKGGRNKGFWYRANRGWYVGKEKLLDAESNHIKSKDDRQAAEQAYHALVLCDFPCKVYKEPRPLFNSKIHQKICESSDSTSFGYIKIAFSAPAHFTQSARWP